MKQNYTLTFQDPSGQPLAGGSVTLRLNVDASTNGASGPQITAGRLVSAVLDDTGSAIVTIWPNDQLFPTDTIYFVTAYTALGEPVWRGQLSFTTTGTGFLLQENLGRIIISEGGFLLWE